MHCSTASPCHYLGSLIPGRDRRYDAGYPREEPGAGKLHARICEGKSRMAELLDHDPPPPPNHALGAGCAALRRPS